MLFVICLYLFVTSGCSCKQEGEDVPDNSCNEPGECCSSLGGRKDNPESSCIGNLACHMTKSVVGEAACLGDNACR